MFVEIPVLEGLLIKPSRTFKEMLSHTTAPVHIRPPFFSAHQRCRIEVYCLFNKSCEICPTRREINPVANLF